MSETTTEQKRAYRVRTADELHKALSTACEVIWNGRAKPGQHVWSIPVDEVRDFDCILSDGINELLDLRAKAGPLTREEAARLWKLGKEATNGWACYARTQIEHREIARLHKQLDELAALFPASEPEPQP